MTLEDQKIYTSFVIKTKKIIHIDLDAFYAAVEIRDNPLLKGKPIIIGGQPHERSVVSTCSYEARKFGIHSAMSSAMAKNFVHTLFSSDLVLKLTKKLRMKFFKY